MRILVLRALGLGDLLTVGPALRGLRRAFPDAEITLAAPGWLADAVARIEAVDRLLPTDGAKDDPAQVAREGFKALMQGEDHVVAGSVKNKAQALAGRLLPDPVKAKAHRKMSEPGSAES